MSDSIFLTNGNGTITGLVAGTSYSGELVIPEYVGSERITAIGSQAFLKCSQITSVIIPNSVTSIDSGAFQRCSSLTSVDIPNSVTNIGNYAFYGTKLTSIVIPNSINIINERTFSNCNSLTYVNIPNSVTEIGINAFYNCSNLVSINIPNGVVSIDANAFSACYGLTSISIPNSIVTIGENAFSKCSALTTIYVSDPNNPPTAVSSYNWSGTGSSDTIVFVINPNNDMLVKAGTLTDIADKIRVLSGTDEALTPVEMSSTLETYNAEMNTVLSEQDAKIAELMEILKGKTAGGTITVTDDGNGNVTIVTNGTNISVN